MLRPFEKIQALQAREMIDQRLSQSTFGPTNQPNLEKFHENITRLRQKIMPYVSKSLVGHRIESSPNKMEWDQTSMTDQDQVQPTSTNYSQLGPSTVSQDQVWIVRTKCDKSRQNQLGIWSIRDMTRCIGSQSNKLEL